MFRSAAMERVRQMFADQFQNEDGGLVYRKNLKGAAIRVSEAERDEFIAGFSARLRWLYWGYIAVALMMVAVLVGVTVAEGGEVSETTLWIGTGVLMAGFMLSWLHVWNAPARRLAVRATVGPELTRQEARRAMLRSMTWGQILIGLIAIPAVLLQVGSDYDLLYGWNLLWLVGGGAFAALIGLQAYRKWRADRE